MLSINCKINFILNWPENCVISVATGGGAFAVNNRKLYIPILTLSNKNNSSLIVS